MHFLRKSKYVSHRVIGGEAFVIDTRTQAMHNLGGSGARIWELIDGTRQRTDIIQMIVDEYDVEAALARKDVDGFVSRLLDAALIEEAAHEDAFRGHGAGAERETLSHHGGQ